MKKIIAGVAAVLAVGVLASCNDKKADESSVLTYDQYVKTEDDKKVTISGYIQAKQSWREDNGVGKASLYLQDDNGAYFIYNLPCTKADYDSKLVVGQNIEVTGLKSSWAGEVEIAGDSADAEATYKILEGTKTYPFYDLTELIGSYSLIDYQNQAAKFKDLVVVAQEDGAAYNYQGGNPGKDIYVKFFDGENYLDACVESYLTPDGSDLYEAVEALELGDVVTIDTYLYWYNGANPHLVNVTKTGKAPVDRILTYSQYVAAEMNSEVTITAYIQAKQSWWEDNGVGKASFYLQDDNGAYFIYNLPCTKADYDTKLVAGQKIKVTGIKNAWAGEVEVVGDSAGAEATYKILEGTKTYPFYDLTELIGSYSLIDYQNQAAKFKDLVVVAQEDGAAYNYQGGNPGKDIYVKFFDGENYLDACVESYLTPDGSDLYEAVEALELGDVVTIDTYLYWYNGANPHLVNVTKTGKAPVDRILTYSQYVAAEMNSEVTITAYIQAKQSWWEDNGVGKASFYLQDDNGAYFIYNLPCTKADYDTKLVAGQKIKVTGIKNAWAGEVEIVGDSAGAEATYEVLEGTKTYSFRDVTSLIGSESLVNYQNQAVKFSNLVVVPQADGKAFNYQGGNPGKDIYVKLFDGKNYLDVCVESYLTADGTTLYDTVETLKLGDVVTIYTYLYWYNGANPHLVSITKSENVLTKSTGVLTYAQYVAAPVNEEVTIEGFVQERQAWWSDNGVGKATIYLDDGDGAYFIYNLQCSEDDYNTKLTIGKKIKITGIKSAWAGEVEIDGSSAGAEATFTVVESKAYVTTELDLTANLGDANLIDNINKKVILKDMTVVAYDETNVPFTYKGGQQGSDIYIKLSNGITTVECCVSRYLRPSTTDTYKTIESLKVGDKVTIALAPIVSSLGIKFPKMSGRGLGHTGGTIDKLESIKGFNVNLSEEEFMKKLERSRKHAKQGKIRDADEMISDMREKYGL